jgi:hypothetical protein
MSNQVILLKDVVAGTFTHRDTYLPHLQASINKYFPDIPFIVIKHDGAVNAGMMLLQKEFMKSGKRFHLYTDDDIIFLNSEIIPNAIATLMNDKYGATIVYMTYDTAALTKPYNASSLVSRPTTVLLGYFILVDTLKVRGIYPDESLPWGSISVDTDFGLAIQASGYELGIANSYIYHQHKESDRNTQEMYLKTNDYLINKWGASFYYDNVKYDNNVIGVSSV